MSKRPAWWLNVLKTVWPLNSLSARATQWPVIGKLIIKLAVPLFSGKNFNISYIPINRDVTGAGSTSIPMKVLEDLIRRSSHRVIINRCTCRDSDRCKVFPIEDACLLLGQGARHIDTRISRHVTVDQAIAHARDRLGLGLIPLIGRARVDDFFWGVPNTGKLLTICFCCPCCCTIFKNTRFVPRETVDSMVRLKGLRLVTSLAACTGCGLCVDTCFTRALSVHEGKVRRNDALCKGCGRCASVCPEKAITLEVDDVAEAVKEIMGRIDQRVFIE